MKLIFLTVLLMQSQSETSAKLIDVFNYHFDNAMNLLDRYYALVKDKLFNIKRQNTRSWNTIANKGAHVYKTTVKGLMDSILQNEEFDPDYDQLKLDPTASMTTDQLIQHHGERVLRHEVETEDGYVLLLHQVLVRNNATALNRSILLYHGLLGSSADWVMRGPKQSLPYLLCDAGFDVWLTNSRGNRYSRAHDNMKASDFWNFTFQEMGKRDLRAVVDYINLMKKNNHKIDFIGHSMGATALLVLLSSYPIYNAYLHIGILLAPLVYMSNIKGPLKVLSESEVSPDVIHGVLGSGEFYPRRIPNAIAKQYCTGPVIFCRNPLFFMAGVLQTTQLDELSFVARLNYHVPAGASTQTIMHYVQMSQTRKFHEFNHPEKGFDLKKVTVPIAIISSDTDWLSTPSDVQKLYANIKNPIFHLVLSSENISHTEFVWGDLAPELIFKKVLSLLKFNDTKDLTNMTVLSNDI